MLYFLEEDGIFPPVTAAGKDGLLAISHDISPGLLLNAYRKGIFPWYNEGQPVLWWYPNPRCVLFPAKLHVSHSMQKLLRKPTFTFKINTQFAKVMQHCREVKRSGQEGTWISDAIIKNYTLLHTYGYAQSAECFMNNELVGGLYGVKMGKVFFGESMFSLVPNASKFAFINFVNFLSREEGIALIDCQITNPHLLSLGAEEISAINFGELLEKYIK
jgi:leucyl/phenylalanyl-tRNA---protein transferase